VAWYSEDQIEQFPAKERPRDGARAQCLFRGEIGYINHNPELFVEAPDDKGYVQIHVLHADDTVENHGVWVIKTSVNHWRSHEHGCCAGNDECGLG
jgi:hypothetical protein